MYNLSYIGGWTLLSASNESAWDINGTSFMVEKILGSPAFFTVDVNVDDKNSSNYIIEVHVLVLIPLLVMVEH